MITFLKYFKYFYMEDVIKIFLCYPIKNSDTLSLYRTLSHLFFMSTRSAKVLKSILQMRKLKKIKELAYDHKSGKGRELGIGPKSFDLKANQQTQIQMFRGQTNNPNI